MVMDESYLCHAGKGKNGWPALTFKKCYPRLNQAKSATPPRAPGAANGNLCPTSNKCSRHTPDQVALAVPRASVIGTPRRGVRAWKRSGYATNGGGLPDLAHVGLRLGTAGEFPRLGRARAASARGIAALWRR